MKFEDIRMSSSSIDDFFSDIKPIKRTAGRVRIASLSQLAGFDQVSKDKLVRVSQKDFWQLGQDEQGYYIERLVDDNDGPVKG